MDTIRTFLSELFRKENRKATVILLYATIALTIWKHLPDAAQLANIDGTRLFPNTPETTMPIFISGMGKILGAFILMGIVPALIVKWVFRESLYDYGVQWGIPVRTFRSMCIMVPFMMFGAWVASQDSRFFLIYPYNPAAGSGTGWFLLHAMSLLLLYYTGWEFFFRGFLQKGLQSSCGTCNAVLIQTALATMAHYRSPECEVWACLVASLFWGFLALRTKSIVSGWVQHATIGVVLDLFLITRINGS